MSCHLRGSADLLDKVGAFAVEEPGKVEGINMKIKDIFGSGYSRDDSYKSGGGGWGHGSGMCQLGAIGRAQRGWDYRRILGWYYSGARPERIY